MEKHLESVDVVDAGINFSHPGLPAPNQQEAAAPQRTQEPAPIQSQPADTAPPAVQPEPTRKFAGKYNTLDEFERGYWNSAQEAVRLASELKTTREILASQQRVNPAERVEAREAFLEELRDAAIPVDALDKLIETRVQRGVALALEPIVRGATARNEMMEQFPEFANVERQLNHFLSANPEVNDEYQRMMTAGFEKTALKYALLNYNASNASKPIADASGQEQAVARATASLSGAQAGSREVMDVQVKRLNDAQAEFELSQDPKRYAAALFDVFRPTQ